MFPNVKYGNNMQLTLWCVKSYRPNFCSLSEWSTLSNSNNFNADKREDNLSTAVTFYCMKLLATFSRRTFKSAYFQNFHVPLIYLKGNCIEIVI